MSQLFRRFHTFKLGDATGFPSAPETTVIPATSLTEAVDINTAAQIDISIKFTTAATGSAEIRRYWDKSDSTDYELLATLTAPVAGTIVSFNYPGVSAASFVRVYNGSSLALSARIQQYA